MVDWQSGRCVPLYRLSSDCDEETQHCSESFDCCPLLLMALSGGTEEGDAGSCFMQIQTALGARVR